MLILRTVRVELHYVPWEKLCCHFHSSKLCGFFQAARLVRGSFEMLRSSQSDPPRNQLHAHSGSPSFAIQHHHEQGSSGIRDVWPQSAAVFYNNDDDGVDGVGGVGDESVPAPHAIDGQEPRRGGKSSSQTEHGHEYPDRGRRSGQFRVRSAYSGRGSTTDGARVRHLNAETQSSGRNARRSNGASWSYDSPEKQNIVVVSNTRSQRSEPTPGEPGGLGERQKKNTAVQRASGNAQTSPSVLKENKKTLAHSVQAVDDVVGGTPHGLTRSPNNARRRLANNIWRAHSRDSSSSAAPAQPFVKLSPRGNFDGQPSRQPRSPPKQRSLRLLHVYDPSKTSLLPRPAVSSNHSSNPRRGSVPAALDPDSVDFEQQHPTAGSTSTVGRSGAGPREMMLDSGPPHSNERSTGSHAQKPEWLPWPSGSIRSLDGRGQQQQRVEHDLARSRSAFPAASKPPVHRSHQPPHRHRAHVHRTPQQQGYVRCSEIDVERLFFLDFWHLCLPQKTVFGTSSHVHICVVAVVAVVAAAGDGDDDGGGSVSCPQSQNFTLWYPSPSRWTPA